MAKLPVKTNIIELIEIEGVSFESKREVLEKATELIEIRSLEKVTKSLGEDKIDEFQELLESEEEEKVYDFLKENSIDLIKITEEETMKVKKELLEAAKELEN